MRTLEKLQRIAPPPSGGPVVILGAGYAGVAVCHAVRKSGSAKIQSIVVDRHPSHTIRTRLYEVGRLAASQGRSERWSVPIDQVLAHDKARFVAGEITNIDLERRVVLVDSQEVKFGALAVCLGNVAAYYGIPGAEEHTEQVYRFQGAVRLAERLRSAAENSALSGKPPTKVVVVGGGSTGTELAAEIATTNWSKVIGKAAPRMEVTMVVGAVPFLAGMPESLVHHAEALLSKAKVRMIPGLNVAKVDPGSVTLQNGDAIAADVTVWCAGLAAPEIVRKLPVPHGKGGRIAVNDRLEVEGHPGVFAVGDSAEIRDPASGLLVPGTAQAALAEAPVAGSNAVAYLTGRPYESFQYKERGMVVEVGRGRGAARFARISVWGRPAALLKAAVDAEYAISISRGREPPGL
ncbi:MAG: FAD-dependent oxidoreductase [Thermoplasmata archaeon]|nr:FAD-dependent oxidoreductase [Thermoplasmata archaeon]